MKVASDRHSCPEKATTRQPPRPNSAHRLATSASASAREAIFQDVAKEPSAVKASAPHLISVDVAGGLAGGDVGASATGAVEVGAVVTGGVDVWRGLPLSEAA